MAGCRGGLPLLPGNPCPSSRAKSSRGRPVSRLELNCDTCGSNVVDPPEKQSDYPTQVCCKAALAKAKAKQRDSG